MAVVVNDSYHPTKPLLTNCPEGLEVMSFANAAKTCPGILEQYYDTLAAKGDATARLNTLLAQDGVMIHVRRGARIDRLIQIVNLFTAAAPTMAVRRVLIVLEEDSELKVLLCDHTTSAGIQFLSSQVVEIFISRGASLELYSMEDTTAETSRCSQAFARLDNEGTLRFNSASLHGGQTRNTYRIDLDGEHAEADLSGLVIADGARRVNNEVNVHHNAPHCRSRQLFKYALYDEARCGFGGNIVVGYGAHHTDASQTNRNLLSSPAARMDARPHLEIYCDDVKCSHGATTGQLDAAALFYMRSRGIPLAEARNMLVQAFMADVLDNIGPEQLRDRLRMLVDKRLCGTHSACGDCITQCSAK